MKYLIFVLLFVSFNRVYSQDKYKWEQYIMYEEKGEFATFNYNSMSNVFPDWTKVYYKGPVRNLKTNKTEIKEGYFWYFFWNSCMLKSCYHEIIEYKEKE